MTVAPPRGGPRPPPRLPTSPGTWVREARQRALVAAFFQGRAERLRQKPPKRHKVLVVDGSDGTAPVAACELQQTQPSVAFLRSMAVAPHCRRRGYARRLLRFMSRPLAVGAGPLRLPKQRLLPLRSLLTNLGIGFVGSLRAEVEEFQGEIVWSYGPAST
ncbi:hypothetical protein AK812_SmicGene29256 [Symbiodinium microadriaticum]|uniref:N-acetyltransferase domain-containing protein n=1 Tax=Symbiodinium microadriaticum TaxID=2951 RepID=A0A1Q9D287_SYMMI|nr:hypothetical protein AK812_SmicGene29256 [Symbiodinium microadriaticum]